MGTGLQVDINGGFRQQGFVFHTADGIHFCMGTSIFMVVPFPYDTAIMNDYGTDQRIGFGASKSGQRQLKTAAHIYVVIVVHQNC
jgi:hypothetical protein